MIVRFALVSALLASLSIACADSTPPDDQGTTGDDQNITQIRAGELGGTCGGFAAIPCGEGLVCRGTERYPDAAGKCEKADDADDKEPNAGGIQDDGAELNQPCGGFAGRLCKAGLTCETQFAGGLGHCR